MYKNNDVFTSVWLAAAVLSFHKFSLSSKYRDLSIRDFFFSQSEIVETAQKLCNKTVQSARVSQWCNGDHKDSSYNYLRENKMNKTRRLTVKGEFAGLEERPTNFIKNEKLIVYLKNGTVEITISNLIQWVEEYYDNLLSSRISEKDKISENLASNFENGIIDNAILNKSSEEDKDFIKNGIINFVDEIRKGTIEIYNEFSLQHELGIYLRNCFGEKYKIQFERNVVSFFNTKEHFTKKEMDIVMYSDDYKEKYCIELKYPRNGQYPEQMFNMCKDIKFIEELKMNGFTKCYLLTIVDDPNFYSMNSSNEIGIYNYFRFGKILQGEIIKPTGEKKEKLILVNEYKIKWEILKDKSKYFITIL